MVLAFGLMALSLVGPRLTSAIQKLNDDETTEINESSSHTSEVIQKFIEDDISVILILLAVTVLAALAWMLCPFHTMCECEPGKSGLGSPLMHEEMETTAQSLRRRARSSGPLRV